MMKTLVKTIIVLTVLVSCKQKCDMQQQTVSSEVNNFIGVDGGNVLPGAFLPFGLVRVSPDMIPSVTTSGYRSGNRISGFSHVHTSGTGGGPRYGNIQVTPLAGALTLTKHASVKEVNEYAAPGYYTITLARHEGDVHCQLTCSDRAALHKYRFFNWKNEDSLYANILIDVSHVVTRGKELDSRCLDASVEILSDTSICGEGYYAGGWGQQNPYRIYFYAVVDKPFTMSGTWNDTVFSVEQKARGTKTGAWIRRKVAQQSEIEIKVGISLSSIEKAQLHANAIQGWNFDALRHETDKRWNEYLSRVQIRGGLPEQRQLFYSCLKNTLIMPTNITGDNPLWESDKPAYWDHYAIWDVFRTVMPLHTLLFPSVQREIINSLLDIYHHKGWLPDAWIAGDYANIQGGTNVDVVIADAVVKKLGGYDIEKAYEAIKKNATVESDNPHIYGRYLNDYKKYGYVTRNTVNGAISRTMEYAYNDYCIAQVAKSLKKEDEYKIFLEQSQKVLNLFHADYGYFWAKDSTGAWEPDFSPESRRSDSWHDPYFYEGGSQTYSYYIPHDMQGLINLHGGKDKFIARLDDFFLSGKFRLGNEPLFLVPYSYTYAGRPDKTALHVRNILKNQFVASRAGLPGQDDSGAISSWYVFSAIGIFPVAGQDIYLIGSPLFEKTILYLENNKTFEIIAYNTSDKNIYVKRAKLNNKKYDKAWLRHADIIKGGSLILEMTDIPSDWGTHTLPPSISTEKK